MMPHDLRIALVVLAAAIAGPAVAAPSSPRPPDKPAKIEVRVAPDGVSPGGTVEVAVRLTPGSGIKINRYPKISLAVEGLDGVAGPAEAKVGNDAPPPPDDLTSNYFHVVDPVVLHLAIAPGARPGAYAVPAKLKYFYCVAASGFCAPKKETISIPVTVR